MNSVNITLVLLLTAFILLTACESDVIVDPPTKANIIGTVNLYNEGTDKLPKDGMLVTVVGSSPLITSVTDSAGAFALSDVTFGSYTISFKKTGFGTFNKVGLIHSDNGGSTVLAPSPSLGQVSTTTITGLTGTYSSSNVKLTITTTPEPANLAPRYIRVFFSKNPAVSFYNYSNYSAVYKHSANPSFINIGIKAFLEMGYTQGETVYARVYGDSYWSNEWENPLSAKMEFPNLNETTVEAVSFIVP